MWAVLNALRLIKLAAEMNIMPLKVPEALTKYYSDSLEVSNNVQVKLFQPPPSASAPHQTASDPFD